MLELLGMFTQNIEVVLGFLTALASLGGIVWKFLVKPMLHLTKTIEDLSNDLPVIHEIASEFRNNGGSTLRDVLDRIQDQLTKASFVQRSLILQSGKAFWETDSEGKWLWASPALCNMIGLEEEAILGHGWVTNIHPDDQERVFNEWQLAIKQDRQFRSFYRFLHTNGSVVKVLGVCFPVRTGRRNRIIGFVGTLEVVD